MALLKDTWLTTAYRKRVQGYNHPYTSYQNAYKTMYAKGNTSGNMATGLLFSWSEYRYPGYGASMPRNFIPSEDNILSNTFDGLSTSNVAAFAQIKAFDYIPRLCPRMQKASDVAKAIRDSKYYYARYIVDLQKTYSAYTPDTYGYYPVWTIQGANSIDLFIATLSDDDLCVLSYQSYEDNESGTNSLISEWNNSAGVVYDVYTPFRYQGPAANPGAVRSAFIGYLSSVLCPNLSRSQLGDMRWLLYDDNPFGLKVAIFSNSTSGVFSVNDSQSIIYGTKEAWTKFFDNSGFAWSFDVDVVQDPDSPDIRQPTTPGQPENPVVTGDGTGDNISDKVLYPSPAYIPNATVYDRYFLTPNQMPDIKKFLFSDTFVDNIKRLWTNPAEYVISLVCYPFDVDNTGLTTTSGVVSVGGVSSDIAAAALTDRGVPYFYGGSVMVDNYYNSYLDYEPYTSIDIYIPYIGVRPLNVSQVVGHTLCIGYYIDLNTQQITALIGLDGQGGNLGQVVTQFVGSIGIQTPLSGTSAQDMIRNIVAQTSGLITGVGAIAGGIMGANPALLASGVASTSNALLGGGHTAPSYYGSLSPVSGLYAPQVAYLIINRPRQAMPAEYLTQQGFSSNYSGKVSQFSGYLECASVNIASTTTMTAQEQQEIINLLTGGIYCG